MRIALIIFSLLIINFPALAAPPAGQIYPYKAKFGLTDVFSSSPCESGDMQGATTGERNTVWCIPEGSRPPAKTTGKCDAGLKPIKIPDQEIFWCIPTAETIEKGGVSNLKCPADSATIFNKDGTPAYCSRPITKENPCSVNDKLYDENDKLTGCRVEPTTIIGAIDIPGGSKIKQDIREYKTQVPIPCDPSFGLGSCPSLQTPAGYIARIYQFGLMVAGLFAFGGIVYGALKYILSAGNVGSQQDAKDQITQAVLGLMLLLGAFIILYTINPQLTYLRNPDAPILDLSVLTPPEEEGGQGQNLTGSDGGDDPLCAAALDVGINLNIHGQARTGQEVGEVGQEVSGRVGEILGASGEKRTGPQCLKCVANASGAGGLFSKCACDPGFSQYNAECVNKCPSGTESKNGVCEACPLGKAFNPKTGTCEFYVAPSDKTLPPGGGVLLPQ